MSIQSSLHQKNGENLSATIANFSEGLPVSAADKPTFRSMILEAHFALAKYNMPNHKLFGGNLLDITYETYSAHNQLKLNDGIDMYGICLYANSTAIKQKPFLNILVALVKELIMIRSYYVFVGETQVSAY
jgi:hypothetical protein